MKKLDNIKAPAGGTLYTNILVGPTKQLISTLVNFGVLINMIFNQLTQQLKIKGYKKEKLCIS